MAHNFGSLCIDRPRPLFEQRHFEWLANWAKENMTHDQRINLAEDLADTNVNFKKDKFLKACGI